MTHRNQPCTCGSGRKHKHCCGSILHRNAAKPGDGWRFPLVCLTAAMFWLATFGLLLQVGSEERLRKRARNWPTTAGYIIEPGTVSWKDRKKNNPAQAKVSVTYEYEVNGKRYVGSRYSVDNSIPRKGMPNSQSRYYKGPLWALREGAVVIVFYDPKNPAKSIIRPELKSNISSFGMVFLILSIASTGAAYWIGHRWLKGRAARRPLTA